ncbi:putative toxin-antitoxin system toxin component, PIN family [Candidatus Curtissbacteria bacterium]|nr:putative toxin-antitoxin system toxin component, PIN family [Candidatus Curtissbacteria bacterium]
MNIDTPKNPARVTLDTNILISAIGFGGKPREILNLILDKQIKAVTSSILLAELEDVITKKFPKLAPSYVRINRQIKKNFKIIKPKISLHVLKDESDNRVLETAIEGNCDHIVTGDKQLLKLAKFKNIKILSAQKFLQELSDVAQTIEAKTAKSIKAE